MTMPMDLSICVANNLKFNSDFVILIINILWYMTICACALSESATPGWPVPNFVAPAIMTRQSYYEQECPTCLANAPKFKERLIGIR